jgi:outer membrane protein TolC
MKAITLPKIRPWRILEKVYFEESIAPLKAQRDQAKANLAKLEAGNRLEDIAQAEANVNEREATVANAKVTFERAEQLLKKAVGPRRRMTTPRGPIGKPRPASTRRVRRCA